MPQVPGQLPLPTQPPPPHEPAPTPSPCACGTPPLRPGWCGLKHHGLGCHNTTTHLIDIPTHPGATTTVAVCARCAHRARWWQADPAARPPTHPGGPLGACLHTPDQGRVALGQRPPYAA